MIYLDNAATTNVSEEVYDAMKPYFCELYANPSAIYSFAGKSMKAINEARHSVASLIGANDKEIYFTASGSEADNWAIKAAAFKYKDKGRHIITSKIEHHAILHTCEYLEKQGFEVTYLDVDENGVVKLDELKKAIREDTILISIMFANNEIGTIEPIKEIGKIAHEKGIIFHTDAVQAYGHVPINVDELGIDILSASGHKINGPKGVGIMYLRDTVKIGSFIHGGAQERGRRAGGPDELGGDGEREIPSTVLAFPHPERRHETPCRGHAPEEDGREARSAGFIPAISCATLPRLVDRDEVGDRQADSSSERVDRNA